MTVEEQVCIALRFLDSGSFQLSSQVIFMGGINPRLVES